MLGLNEGRTMEDPKTMMAQGEEFEEFCLRACLEAQKVNAFRGDALLNELRVARESYLDGQITREQYDAALENVTRAALNITGPLEPSTEYVGYF
jgi:hypothetical protein